ncbi:MAG: M28 family peptidase [Planctomycetota bacterium]
MTAPQLGRLAAPVVLLAALCAPAQERSATRPAATPAGDIEAATLEKTVRFLASPDFEGRRAGTDKADDAGEWVKEQLQALGCVPGNGDSWYHSFPLPGGAEGRNVIGVLRSGDDVDEYVLVGAHHDGQGRTGSAIRPSAEDNATGVAAMLEIARWFATHREGLRVNVVFASFDGEELGLLGSRYFVGNQVIPTEKLRFVMVFDMLGCRFMPWQERRLYVMGGEHSKEVDAVVEKRKDGRGVAVRPIGTYVLEPLGAISARSDYAAFRGKRVPYLFLSTATPWYYHQVQDTPDRVDYGLVEANARFARDVLRDLATAEGRPAFIDRPDARVRDAVTMLEGIDSYLEHAHECEVGGAQLDELRLRKKELEALVEAGEVDRKGRRTIQNALVTSFKLVPSTRNWKPAKEPAEAGHR